MFLDFAFFLVKIRKMRDRRTFEIMERLFKIEEQLFKIKEWLFEIEEWLF